MTDVFSSLLEARSAAVEDADRSPGAPGRLLVRSDLTGTMQLYELLPPAAPRPLTALPEPVGAARFVPGGSRVVLEADAGGNERHQLYLLDTADVASGPVTDFGELAALTADPASGHHLAGVSADGRLAAYVSNRRNGVDFDLWLCDLESGGHRCLYADGGWCQPASGFSPDGRWVSFLRPGSRPLDTDLLLADTLTGEVRTVLPHPDEAAWVGPPAWAGTGACYVSSNVGRDNAVVVRYDLASGRAEPVAAAGDRWDAEPATSADGSTLAITENRGGASRITLYRLAGAPRAAAPTSVALPERGVVASHAVRGPLLSADGSQLYFTLTTPRLAGDVWACDTATGAARRLTHSPSPVPAATLPGAETAEVVSFDGERIPLFFVRPPGVGTGEPPPAVVVVHGGPESQSVLSFNPVVQGLAAAGYGVVIPNVRGSTGYGKRYASLDDTTRRLDSVRDLAAVHRWLASAGFDPGRAALWGGSYGGYMVLAGLAFQPDLWAAGVDIVGISDLVTFLENTSAYRRAHREREYGSLAHDREFLASASPLRHADAIRAPLFVIHGRNDPRVPLSETGQLVTAVRDRGVRCEMAVYDDEGHGLARLANRLDAYPRAVAFLGEVLRPRSAAAG